MQTSWRYLLTFSVNFVPLWGDFGWRPPIGVLWSVAVEEQAYLLLPILVGWCRPKFLPGAVFVLAGLSAASRRQHGIGAWWYPFYSGPQSSLLFWDHMTWARMDGILLGVLAAWAMRRSFTFPGHPLPWIVGLLLVANGPGAGAAALVLALSRGALPMAERLLELKPLRFLGRVSYGIYLIHPFVQEMLERHTSIAPGLLRFELVAAPTVVLAYLSWTFFEEPILRWGSSRIPAKQTSATAA